MKDFRPIVFVFDTNAHSYIADSSDFENIISKLKAQSQPLIPHLTFINFFEYLKMVKDDVSLKEAQNYVKKLKRITLGGSLLPLAKLHVQSVVGAVSREELKTDVKVLLRNMNTLLRISSFEEFQTIVTPSLEADLKRISDIVAGYEDMKMLTEEVLKEYRNQKKVNDFKRWLSGKAQKEYLEMFVQRAIARFDLTLSQFNNDIKLLFEKLPSVRYVIFVFLHYVRQLVLNKRKPKTSDYNDLELVPYLNVADYIVTRDNFLRDLINDCGEDDLKGRAISCEEFVDKLDKNMFVHRAPNSCLRLNVDLD
ncbi:MAG: hypothetical protein KAT58_08705 [candidate division Zixibacteria bacterium]|nr:hypothetical protein [candidate division Zixibacteria bacterium]